MSRAHASTAGVTKYFETCRAGFLMEKELKFLNEMMGDPARPFVAVLGGAKVDSKVAVILNLLGKVELWGIGTGTQLRSLSLRVGQLTGAQLQELIKRLPDGMHYELGVEKEDQ